MSLQLVVPAESEYKRLNKLDMKPDVSKRYIADLTPMDAALLNEHAREAGLITAAGYCVKACDAELIKGPLGDLIFRQPHCIQGSCREKRQRGFPTSPYCTAHASHMLKKPLLAVIPPSPAVPPPLAPFFIGGAGSLAAGPRTSQPQGNFPTQPLPLRASAPASDSDPAVSGSGGDAQIIQPSSSSSSTSSSTSSSSSSLSSLSSLSPLMPTALPLFAVQSAQKGKKRMRSDDDENFNFVAGVVGVADRLPCTGQPNPLPVKSSSVSATPAALHQALTASASSSCPSQPLSSSSPSSDEAVRRALHGAKLEARVEELGRLMVDADRVAADMRRLVAEIARLAASPPSS